MIRVGKIDTRQARMKANRFMNRASRDSVPIKDATGVAADAARQNATVDTGELLESIEERVEFDKAGSVGIVEATAPHAPFVELGTSRMGPQPFMRPALKGPSRRRIVERYRSTLASRARTY